ncbi:MAG: conjugal transfer protein TraF [Gammaproteobacteria bacterium]|nr:conjugal transfer protein TraF [Gammaproteobacteria bacterium]MDH5801569.1 conjugal transfer protein TraF [Gammaproteobacteria bacterium]
MQTKKMTVVGAVLMGWLVFAGNTQAFSFLTFEARSAAMGGVGVATETRNASFYNPALLATNDESYDWYAIAPAYSESYAAPGGLDSKIKAYTANTTPANLQAMSGLTLRERDNTAFAFGVPSVIVSGSVFYNSLSYHTISTDVSVPVVKHRSADMRELGFNLGVPLDIEFRGIGKIKVGAGLKLLLVEGYADDQAASTATVDHVRSNESVQSSGLNLDFGIAREVGVWKTALVIKNLFSRAHDLGLGDSIKVEPQIRAGFAYRSRRTIYEVDLDLRRSAHVGHDGETQYLSAGLEHKLVKGLSVRAGYRQSLVGEVLPTISYGIGMEVFGYIVDVAGMVNEDEESLFAQFSLQL